MKLGFFEHGGMNATGFRLFDYSNNHTISMFSKQWRLWHEQTFNRAGQKLTVITIMLVFVCLFVRVRL